MTTPDPVSITEHITTAYPDTDVVTIEGASFFSLDADKHWPNFATIVWSDETDLASDLMREGVFRLNMGVSRATFDRLVASVPEPDPRTLDRILPHPFYARQHWLSILSPSAATFAEVAVPLLADAHDRLAVERTRHARTAG